MPLPRVYKVVQDSLGNVVPLVSCSVLLEGTGTLATLWQDDAGTIPLSNPMISDATYGSFAFYVTPAHYDLTFTKPGYTFQSILDLQVPQDDLTLGTMAQQDANAVAITGGSVTGLTNLGASNVGAGVSPAGTHALSVNGAVQMFGGDMTHTGSITAVLLTGSTQVTTPVLTATTSLTVPRMAINSAIVGNVRQQLNYPKTGEFALAIKPTDTDAGGGAPVVFQNLAGATVGSIGTNAAATSYNTSSDVRLKNSVQALTGALAVVQALRPVAFRWRSDDSPGHGFIASEVQQVVDGVISGEADAVNDDGSVRPQQIDPSKLVVWVVSAMQELAAQLEAAGLTIDGLMARVASLETQLGV